VSLAELLMCNALATRPDVLYNSAHSTEFIYDKVPASLAVLARQIICRMP